MAESTHPNLALKYDWDLGEPYKPGMDANLRMLGAVVHLAVKSRTSDEPSSPTDGDRYIHNGGTWSVGNADDVIARIGGSWYAFTPATGWWAYIDDEAVRAEYVSGWQTRHFGREVLTAPRTYYVDASSGSDANDGLSAASAFATIQKAIDTAATIDLAIYDVTIDVADGTYGQVVPKGCIGSGKVVIEGNVSTPRNVVLDFADPGHAAAVVDASSFNGNSNVGTTYVIKGMKITGTAAYGIWADGSTQINFDSVVFGAISNGHIRSGYGGMIQCTGTYEIDDGPQSHLYVIQAGKVNIYSAEITLNGTPDFGVFAAADRLGYINAGNNTFNGDATGKRYAVAGNAVIDSSGGGSTYFPGDAAGTEDTGGVYV